MAVYRNHFGNMHHWYSSNEVVVGDTLQWRQLGVMVFQITVFVNTSCRLISKSISKPHCKGNPAVICGLSSQTLICRNRFNVMPTSWRLNYMWIFAFQVLQDLMRSRRTKHVFVLTACAAVSQIYGHNISNCQWELLSTSTDLLSYFKLVNFIWLWITQSMSCLISRYSRTEGFY